MTDFRVIYEAAADGSISASVVRLPVFTLGVDRADAEASTKEALALYLDTLAESGQPAPDPDVSIGVVTA